MNKQMNLDNFFWWLRGAFTLHSTLVIDKEVASKLLDQTKEMIHYSDLRLVQIRTFCELIVEGSVNHDVFSEKIRTLAFKDPERVMR